MPRSQVIPVLAYPDLGEAIDWLCDAFGLTLLWKAANHRAHLNVGDGAVAVTQGPSGKGQSSRDRDGDRHSVMVRIEDVDAHHGRAKRRGARILDPPKDYPYGERQYTVEDLGGHVWTFSQSIADVAPEKWGGASVHL